jgi:sterol desaturase/sphingolipid hydroxylase (fatty acid hydroxylase superfamily)
MSKPLFASLLSPVSDRLVLDTLPAFALGEAGRPRPASRRFAAALVVEAAVLSGLTLAGLLCPWGVGRFYQALALVFVALALPVNAVSLWLAGVAERSPLRLQGPRRRPLLALRGMRDTTLAAWIAACLAAWPVSRAWAGLPTGLVWSLEAAGGLPLVIGETVGALLVLDAWLYWKHRLLHTRALFAFHRFHHVYRDPSSLASFAVGPVESLLTFWPVLLVAFPAARHFAPLYFPLVVVFILFNLYLHCGFPVRILEATLPRLYINTAVFHNVHHANAEAHFGEAMTLWDHICKTRLVDRKREGDSG